jgi:hypothetical protein
MYPAEWLDTKLSFAIVIGSFAIEVLISLFIRLIYLKNDLDEGPDGQIHVCKFFLQYFVPAAVSETRCFA